MSTQLAVGGAAVVGLGTMGRGLVQILLEHGIPVRAYDRTRPDESWRSEVGLSASQISDSLEECVRGAGVVFEAVSEDQQVKAEVLRTVSEQTAGVIASNTSTFQPGLLARSVADPGRLLVAHFFNPAPLIPLVEVVPHAGTRPEVTSGVVDLLEELGKRVVVLRSEVTGFVANRLQAAVLRECFSLIESGIVSHEEIDDVVRFALAPRWAAVGPLGVADLGGLDVFRAVCSQIFPSLDSSTTEPRVLVDMVAAGRLGAKSGGGFYVWSEDERKAAFDRIEAVLAGPAGAVEA